MKRYVEQCDCGWAQTYSTPGRARRGTEAHACPEPERVHRRSCRRCGWSGQSSTAKIADRAKRQHSCERQIARREARERRELREQTIDRTPQPCRHKEANHQHGTYACYVLDACRCRPCATANAAYEAERTRLQAYGRWNGLVDAEPARQHVRWLMTSGMGLKQIGADAGVSGGVMNKLIYGHPRADGTRRPPAKRIKPATADRLLAVELRLADGARTAPDATARRLQALMALGWSGSSLARRLGVLPANFTPLLHGRRQVTIATAKAVHALYRDLAETLPPRGTHRERGSASRAQSYAREHGWAPPLRIAGRLHIGSPLDEALPEVVERRRGGPAHRDEARVERVLGGEWPLARETTPEEKTEILRRWLARGGSERQLCKATGWKEGRHKGHTARGAA